MYFGLPMPQRDYLFDRRLSRRRRFIPKVMKHSQTRRGFILELHRESSRSRIDVKGSKTCDLPSFASRRSEFSSGMDIERAREEERERKDKVSP